MDGLDYSRNPFNEREHWIATNYVGLASYTILIYDHILTFPDEINYIWKLPHKGLNIYLFVLNRYFFPLAFIVNLYAYFSPTYTSTLCEHFIRYEGACVIIGLGIAGLMMMIRVNALFARNRLILTILILLWVFQIGVYSWLLVGGMPVPRSDGMHGCSLIFKLSLGGKASLSSVAPLVFDTAVVVFTLYRTLYTYRRQMTGTLVKTLLQDGILYYSVVFTSNLALTLMIVFAPPGLKNILGQFAQLMTVTMLSRVTIHLRKVGAQTDVVYLTEGDRPHPTYNSTSRTEDSGCDLIHTPVRFATNPDPVGSVSSVTLAAPQAEKGKSRDEQGAASVTSRNDAEGPLQTTSIGSVDSAMFSRPVSFAHVNPLGVGGSGNIWNFHDPGASKKGDSSGEV